MKWILRFLVLSLAIGCVWPDIAFPPPKGERIKMRVLYDQAGAGGPVLEIPARLLRQHAALLDISPGLGGGRGGGIRMLLAGALLSAAIVLFGRAVWKRREQKRPHLLLAFAALLGTGALLRTATADDYGHYDPGNLNAIGKNGPYEGTVAVQITNDGNAVILHLSAPREPRYPRPPHP